jgi:hypothetical protein
MCGVEMMPGELYFLAEEFAIGGTLTDFLLSDV